MSNNNITRAVAASRESGTIIPLYAWVVAVLTAAHTMSCTTIMILPAVAPVVATDYGIDPSLIGYQISVMGLGVVLALVFFGNLTRRVGSCRATQIGHGLVGLGALLMLLPFIAFLLPGSLAFGFGFGVLGPANSALLTRFSPPERRNLLFSIQQTSIPSGGILAAIIAPAFAVSIGWRWAFVLVAVLGFAFVAFLEHLRTRWGDEPDASIPLLTPRPLGALTKHWRNRELRLLSIGGAACCWGQFCVSGYTVVACVEVLNMSLILAGTVLIVLNITTAIGRMIAGWFADRYSAASVLAWMSCVWFATSIAMLWLGPDWHLALVYVLFSVLGIAAGAWPGIVLAEVGYLAPKGLVGPYVSGTLVYTNLGKFIGPMLFAASYALTRSYAIAFALMGGPALVAAYCMFAVERDRKRLLTESSAIAR